MLMLLHVEVNLTNYLAAVIEFNHRTDKNDRNIASLISFTVVQTAHFTPILSTPNLNSKPPRPQSSMVFCVYIFCIKTYGTMIDVIVTLCVDFRANDSNSQIQKPLWGEFDGFYGCFVCLPLIS